MLTSGKSKDMIEKMAGCNLDIQINNQKSQYELGETVSGFLYIYAEKDVKSKQVVVEAGYKAYGRGNTQKAYCSKQEVFKGTITPGRHRYPFSFQIKGSNNNIPNSHQGHYINIDWFVFARAYISWRIDPRAEQVFNVQSEKPIKIQYEADNINDVSKKMTQTSVVGVIAAILLLISFYKLFSGFAFWAVLMLLAGVASLCACIYFLNKYLKYKKYGHVEVDLSRTLNKNNELEAQLTILPNQDIEVESIRVYLEYEEEAVSGSGTSEVTHSHEEVIDERDIALSSNILAAQNPSKNEFSLRFPHNPTKSFNLTDNKIMWRIQIVVDEDINFSVPIQLR